MHGEPVNEQLDEEAERKNEYNYADLSILALVCRKNESVADYFKFSICGNQIYESLTSVLHMIKANFSICQGGNKIGLLEFNLLRS
jgi:hypothetical protein